MKRVALCAAALCIASCPAAGQTAGVQLQTAADGKIRIVRQVVAPETLAAQREIREEVPVLRGIRLPLAPGTIGTWPTQPPGPSAPPNVHEAAHYVAENLACKGLISTTARAIELLGTDQFEVVGENELLLLRSVGIPTDLLDWFPISPLLPLSERAKLPRDDRFIFDAREYVRILANTVKAKGSAAALDEIRYFASGGMSEQAGGFMALTPENGAAPARLVRLQLSKGDYWRGPGDGSSLDIAAQLVAALPEADFLISTSYESEDAILDAAAKWPLTRQSQVTIVSSPWKPQQWAQDNGKPGSVSTANGGRMPATLVPRYASRGEERTTLDPAESFTIAALGAANHTLAQSPLIFQGGNVMLVTQSRNGSSPDVVLVGEAEIERNCALGLSRDEVIQAFSTHPTITFGLPRPANVIVLPAVSFHIDMEVCCRLHEGEIVALVNDDVAASRLIIASAARAFARAGVFDRALADQIAAAADAGEDDKLIDLVAPAVAKLADGHGRYPVSIAEKLSAGPVDSGVGNMERFLLALDILAAKTIPPDQLPEDPNTRAYIQALHHRAADRAKLHGLLKRPGWRVVPIPSLSDETRSMCYVNGFHLPGQYLMPAYGGIYADVDAAVGKVISEVFEGQVKIVPILCGETQRRLGAIHCAASIYCWE